MGRSKCGGCGCRASGGGGGVGSSAVTVFIGHSFHQCWEMIPAMAARGMKNQ